MSQSNPPNPGKGNVRAYQNIMESLVQQEIHRQVKRLPAKLVEYIDVAEVATFALNRLPPLYASSEQGKERQSEKGQIKLKQEVATAVRQALAAVQRDPLRNSTPLSPTSDPRYQDAEIALRDLEKFLRDCYLIESGMPDMDWGTMKLIIAKALKKTAQKGIVDRKIDQIVTEWDHHNYTAPVFDWVDPHYKL